MTRTWLWHRNPTSSISPSGQFRPRVQPSLEVLEDRCLLSGDAALRTILAPPLAVLAREFDIPPEARPRHKADAQTKQVKAFYRKYLRRAATKVEIKKGLRILKQASPELLEAKLLGSGEYYRTRAKKNLDRFLKVAAKDALGRDLDAALYQLYRQMLKSGTTRRAVAVLILQGRNPPPTPDTQPPLITIAQPGANLATRGNITVTGRVSDDRSGPLALQAQVDAGAFVPIAVDAGGNFRFDTALPLDGSAEGAHTVRLRATDAAGNVSALSQLPFTLDTLAPQIVILAPPSGQATRTNIAVTGQVSDARPGPLTLEAQVDAGAFVPVAVDAGGNYRFDTTLPLDGSADGGHTVRLRATDQLGNVSARSQLALTLDTLAPQVVILAPPSGQTTSTNIAVTGRVTDGQPGPLTLEAQVDTGAFVAVAVDADGDYRFDTTLPLDGSAEGAHTVRFRATDQVGNISTPVELTFTLDTLNPPIGAPPLDMTVATTMFAATQFLYTGSDPIQTGVAPGTIEPVRAAVLRGRVTDQAGAPLANVAVTILGHPEFGATKTRGDGMFDTAVNGGGMLTVNYTQTGFLPVQRSIDVPWQDYALVDDVVMIPLDSQVTTIDLTSAAPIQVARGSVVTDLDGTRQNTLLFTQGTQATMTLPDSSIVPLTTLDVRATEYTVGPTGPDAMPANLPPSSGYTYCVELSVDAALAAGAISVNFDRPVYDYVENFLDFPVGTPVPVGFYDRVRGLWVASDNGRVIQIISESGGLAEIDGDGDGDADTAVELAALGFTDVEREQLAVLYDPGQELWRVAITHFTPWDCNWPYGPPPDARPPTVRAPTVVQGCGCLDCEKNGSIIKVQSQTLAEEVPLAGSGFGLRYESSRTAGQLSAITLDIALSDDSPPASLKRIELEVTVAGRRFTQQFGSGPNQTTTFTWDGRDAFGRLVQGNPSARVTIGYVYDTVYQAPADFAQSFARLAGIVTGDLGRREVTASGYYIVNLGRFDALSLGLGGWQLTAHHVYDPSGQVLYLGDGSTRSVEAVHLGNSVSTIAGTGVAGFSGDGGPATLAQLDSPTQAEVGPDGSIYIVEGNNNRIRKIDPAGVITTIAGTGVAGFSGDGGPATLAQLANPTALSIGPDGSLYVFDAGNVRIRRIAPDRTITTVVGTGVAGFSGDGGPATLAMINEASVPRAAPDGSLYVIETNAHRIRQVSTSGIIETIMGTGTEGFSGDDGPASLAQLSFPTDMAFGLNGSLFIGDAGNGRIRQVGVDGRITTYAGNPLAPPVENSDGLPASMVPFTFETSPGVFGVDLTVGRDGSLYLTDLGRNRVRKIGPDTIVTTAASSNGSGMLGDGGLATAAEYDNINSISIAPDGALILADSGQHRIRRVAPALPDFTNSDLFIPSEDGTEVYRFDPAGRHLRTLDALTGVTLLQFGYTGNGLLVTVTDTDGNVTQIERDADGKPTAIVGPFGHRTTLTLNADGYLSKITNPAGDAVEIGYQTGGLLNSFKDEEGRTSTMTYDTLGRLTRDQNAAGGFTQLDLVMDGEDRTVTVTTAEGVVEAYQSRELASGGMEDVVIGADGLLTRTITAPNGTRTTTYADGTSIVQTFGPDPRFGMLSPVLVSQFIVTPSGLTSTLETSRTATLTDPANWLSLTQLVETTTLNGDTFTTTFDAVARTLTTVSPEGRTGVATFDALNHLVREEVPGVTAVDYDYDARGRLISVTQGTRTATLAYGLDGLLASITDPLNQTTTFTRDLAGRVISTRRPDGQDIAFAYDRAGDLTGLTPPGRGAHQFDYNDAGDPESYTPPDLGPGSEATMVSYNLDRQETLVTRPDGTTIGLGYDFAGRLQTVTTAEGVTMLSYHAATGLLTGITAPDGENLAYTYDGDLLKSTTWSGPVAGSVSQTYNAGFLVTEQMINGGDAVTFQYDNDGLLTQAGSLALTYDPQNGRLTGTTLESVTDTYDYNALGEVESYEARFNATTLLNLSDTRDALGRITSRIETVQGVAHTLDYAYDLAGRLTEVKRDTVVVATYTYDANGNRLSFTGPGGTVNGTYDAQDRMTQYGATTYTYTLVGELQSKTDAGGTTTYDYDALGNLRSVELANDTDIEYVIDGLNRRVGKMVDGTLVQGFLYDGALRPLAELDGSGAVVSRFVYATGINVPDYMVKGGVTYRLITDQVGSVRLVVDAATGAVAQRLDYEEFGRVTQDTNPGFQPFGFAGGLYDRDTGLVRFGARDYDAETGRWTAKDPIGFAGGQTNLCTYAENEPINRTDPFGLDAVDELASRAHSAEVQQHMEDLKTKPQEDSDNALEFLDSIPFLGTGGKEELKKKPCPRTKHDEKTAKERKELIDLLDGPRHPPLQEKIRESLLKLFS